MEVTLTITYYFWGFFPSVGGHSAYEIHRKQFKNSKLKKKGFIYTFYFGKALKGGINSSAWLR